MSASGVRKGRYPMRRPKASWDLRANSIETHKTTLGIEASRGPFSAAPAERLGGYKMGQTDEFARIPQNAVATVRKRTISVILRRERKIISWFASADAFVVIAVRLDIPGRRAIVSPPFEPEF